MKKIKLDKEIKCSSAPFWSSDKSEMYKAVIDLNDENTEEENGLFYAVKMIRKNSCHIENTLMKEMKITHWIENSSPESVIIPVLMVCSEEKNSYAVMQFKKNGKFLNELIRDLETEYGAGHIPMEIQLTLVSKILSALYQVHHCMGERGFLHLDIQPCNIFVENINGQGIESGAVKFIDFESAQPVGSGWKKDSVDEVEVIRYTEGFSALEIFEASEGTVGYYTDVFSVAAIMYRMVTGEVFCSHNAIDKISIPGFSILEYQLKMVLRCGLEYNTRYRYPDALSMKKAVEQLQACQQAYKNRDFFHLLSSAYINWIPQKNVIADHMSFDSTDFHLAVERLSDSLMHNGIDLRRCDYIFTGLWKIKEMFCEELQVFDICCLISDGISLSNYLGNPSRGISLYEELDKYKDQISVTEYMKITNRIAVIYSDHYDFKKAYQCIRHNIDALEMLKETYKKMAVVYQMESQRAVAVYDLGRAYSAMGCYMALLHEDDPMVYFEKAIREFDWQTGNISITWSHIMHYAIQIEDGSGKGKALYEQYAYQYFEHECNLVKRYETARAALTHRQRPDPYPLWIFLKGLLRFYPEKYCKTLQELIVNDFYEGKYDHYNTFPMPLIYRYLALLEYVRNNNQANRLVLDAFHRSMTCCDEAVIHIDRPLNILMCINYDTQSIWNHVLDDEDANADLLDMLLFHAQKYKWNSLADKIRQTGSFQGLLEFEYC